MASGACVCGSCSICLNHNKHAKNTEKFHPGIRIVVGAFVIPIIHISSPEIPCFGGLEGNHELTA